MDKDVRDIINEIKNKGNKLANVYAKKELTELLLKVDNSYDWDLVRKALERVKSNDFY